MKNIEYIHSNERPHCIALLRNIEQAIEDVGLEKCTVIEIQGCLKHISDKLSMMCLFSENNSNFSE